MNTHTANLSDCAHYIATDLASLLISGLASKRSESLVPLRA